ncbi:MAG: hypothetical protein Q7T57_08930 [Dehalococcoidales bacterium]|nr:hypothetical protein [Dehalococcoidales bacterium]
MSFLWLIIPVLIVFPLFFLTMSVSIIASRVQLRPRQMATSETIHLDSD